MQAIKKLKENKIFGKNTIVESYIEKTLWGTPLYKKAFFLVKKANDNDCVCERLGQQMGKHIKSNILIS